AGLERLGDSLEALIAELWSLRRPIYLIDHERGGLKALTVPALAALATSLARSGGFSQLWLGLAP
ncbi:MAG: hypothetical protein VX179_08220, partial [Pseudomonadota bacterium]|nr:hypothetical protein [Pseudomonadota bacterium]